MDLPWRRTRNPFEILVAELLLRKTNRRQVALVYDRLLDEYPSPKSLSRGRTTRIKRIIKPLGMQHLRASILKAVARQLQASYGGDVPKAAGQLMKLRGVGQYTANAVMCFAFDERVSLLDTNIARVIQRVFSFKFERRPREDRAAWNLVKDLLPYGRAREFNFAILDFASLVCKPRKPMCPECPLVNICDYGRAGFPVHPTQK